MFGKLFGKKKASPQITDKQVQDALRFSHEFLKICQGFLPDDFEKTLTADKFYILVGFQFGAFSASAHIVGLTPSVTVQIFPTLLEMLIGVSKEKAQAIMDKIPDLIDQNYPPIEIGSNALDNFYSSDSESVKIKYAQELAQLISRYEKGDRNQNNGIIHDDPGNLNAQQDAVAQQAIQAAKILGAQSAREAAEITMGREFSDSEWDKFKEPWNRNWKKST